MRLQRVGPDLVSEADAASFLAQVDEDARSGGGDLVEGALELIPAIALQALEDFAGQAF
jgi:hypothetical protein